jgi:tellurite resistance protein
VGLILWLVIAHPQVGIPVAVVAIVVSVVKHRMSPNQTTKRAVNALEAQRKPDLGALSALKGRDPGFVEDAFLGTVRRVFAKVQDAWARGNMDLVRPLLSDGLRSRFATQLSIMKHSGVRDAIADYEVKEARIHAAETGAHFDTLHVFLRAATRDTEVEATLTYEAATAAAKKGKLSEFTEVWSFLRRPGAKTLNQGGVLEGRCPHCGAPLPSAEAARCEHCQAIVNSGDHDWVLAEITQTNEWRPSSSGRVPGLEELSAQDPALSRQALEDRASYLFWRWIEALVTKQARPLRKVAGKSMLQSVTQQVATGTQPMHSVAVGAVDLVACEKGNAPGVELVHVKILWSSARSKGGQGMPNAHVLTLSRPAGAKLGAALSYARCPECSGPLSENDAATCDFCGTDVPAKQTDFVLEAVRAPEEVRISNRSAAGAPAPADGAETDMAAWIPDLSDRRERALLLVRMAVIAVSDGNVDKRERKMLQTAAKRWGLPMDGVEPILVGQVPADLAMTMKPQNPQAFLGALAAAALVDGRIDNAERKLIFELGRDMGLPTQEVSSVLLSAQARMSSLGR